ncbi:MAG: TldD/PmbA family protein [Acidobacteria bacterium]|nr:TldD/PmbA family protein [Acidobacteriota bacterium]
MFENSFLEEVKSNLERIKGDFKEVYIENKNLFTVDFDKEWKRSLKKITGLGLKVEKGNSTIFKRKQSNDLNKLSDFIKYFDQKDSLEPRSVKETRLPHPKLDEFYGDNEVGKFVEKLTNTSAFEKDFKKATVAVLFEKIDVAIVNSEGVITNEERNFSTIYLKIEEDSSKPSANSKIISGKKNVVELEEEFEKVLCEAKELSSFKKSSSPRIWGKMAVVLSSRAAGFLFNEALSHFFEADLENKTNFSRFLGETIAPEFVDIYDNGPINGIAVCDDEGFQPPSPVVLLEKGKVANLLTNRKSAKTLSLKRTGNARRCSFRVQPIVGIWNISLKPSTYDEMELIENVDFGLYVKRLEDGYLSIKKGKFSFPITESYFVRGGKICEGVQGVSIKGTTPHLLNQIKLIGNKCETYGGLRAKGAQFYQTFESVPPVLMKEMTITPIK